MKKYFYLAAIAAIMVSCAEQDEKVLIEKSTPLDLAVQINPPENWTSWDDDLGCQGDPLNCMPVVIVRPHMQAAQTDLESAVVEGPGSVAQFFTAGDYDVLFPDLNNQPVVLAELQSGNYQGVISAISGIDHYVFGDVSLSQQQLLSSPFVVLRTQ